MLDPKEIYLEEVEKEAGRLEDIGLSHEAAYDRASEVGYDLMTDRIADAADAARQRMKDERYE